MKNRSSFRKAIKH